MLKQISVDMPLSQVLNESNNYGRYIKNLISSKGKFEEASAMFLHEECSKILESRDMPPKLGDPGKFLIPCSMGNSGVYDALADLGASVNLMPYSLNKRLNLGDLKPTRMGLKLGNQTFDTPSDIAEDLVVEVGEIKFPVDFVILDMPDDKEVPIILGRPFLNTADTIILVQRNKLNLDVGDKRVMIEMHPPPIKPIKSKSIETCFQIDIVEDDIEKYLNELL
ncbi:uncharacterized protein [Rutidosis leptorrhynchoides]|uniref:uncharacterized protein n=1 Tax=Rutidosis leptorrhynchoides TaxID=125765 RepID=UPI003A992983